MGRWFRAFFYLITGRFSSAAEALQSNKYVMAATYDKSIEKQAERFGTVQNAVAELMSIEQSRISTIKDLTNQHDDLIQTQLGAKSAMQRRINQLRSEGKSKEEISLDSEFIRHSSAYNDLETTIAEKDARIEDLESDLKDRQQQIATYKAELQQMQRQQAALKEEKQEALADVAIASQAEAINNVLTGMSQDTIDKDLEAARTARQKAKAKSKITSELAGNDARLAESEYKKYASEERVSSKLDKMLDWGDENSVESDQENAQVQ